MTKLVTGGTGFIGAAVARLLVERGEDVILFDVAPNPHRFDGTKGHVKFVPGDLKVWPEVFNAVKNNHVDGIYHLGAMLSLPSEANPWASFQVNVMGTMYILEAARLLDVEQVVFASTSDTYGLGIEGTITDETIQRPVNAYGCGKLASEAFGRYYRSNLGVDFRGVRICAAVVGPGVTTPVPSQYNAWMIEAAALGKPYECYVTEDTRLPVIYFKDIARAFQMLYDAPYEKIQTVVYNVGGIKPARTAKELELAIKKLLPDAQISYKPDPQTMEILRQQLDTAVDDSRAREEWGWEPRYGDLDELIADFATEVREHPGRHGLA